MAAGSRPATGPGPLTWGLAAAASLLVFYFGLVSVSESPAHALGELGRLWYWVAALAAGFGVQAGLFAHVRRMARLRRLRGPGSSLAAGGGVSGASMVACCAHHLADVLPLVGLSAAAAFLGAYQEFFLLLGVVSNLLGIIYMLSVIARHRLYDDRHRWLAQLARLDYGRVFRVAFPALALILAVGALARTGAPEGTRGGKPEAALSPAARVDLASQEVAGDGVWVVVSGWYDRREGVATFELRLTTHSGSLDFAVDEAAAVVIDRRQVPGAGIWEGPGPGGHHRSGTLRFANLPGARRQIGLVLSAEGRLGTRSFEWRL